MNIVELDTLRCESMRALLDERGRAEIWKYDVIESRQALNRARWEWDFDNIEIGFRARSAGHPYALVGPGICDHHFSRPDELLMLVRWLCTEGYLSCYWNRGC